MIQTKLYFQSKHLSPRYYYQFQFLHPISFSKTNNTKFKLFVDNCKIFPFKLYSTTTTAMAPVEEEYDYDFVIIGGGSGGMAAAKEASKHGLKTALFDYVKPTVHGTKWGLGGTCVNVGCVPKKLMHYGALMGVAIEHDASAYGWNFGGNVTHNWQKMSETVQNYVRSLNFGYRNGLRSNRVTYINALASFKDANTIQYKLNGKDLTLKAKNYLIAVGGRPIVPDDVVGAKEHAITSDDLFWLKKSPGKTLVVGGSYIALECAGFMHAYGLEVTVAVRSIVLRGFDRLCSEKVALNMQELGVKFQYHNLPQKIEKSSDNRLIVTMNDGSAEVFDTVLYAIGRYADTDGLGLDKANIPTIKSTGKINVSSDERCPNQTNIYAVGDVTNGRPELTPVAIKSGEYLARRIAGVSNKLMDYNLVATAVFTPFEYGTVGYSQEVAEQKFGAENIEVYLFEFGTLEFSATHRHKHKQTQADEYDTDASPANLTKLVCLKTDEERVVGFHFVGPNAGEITQGFALALRLGAKKSDFDDLIGIHPTDAESLCSLDITARSGESYRASGGCGGGKCG